MQPSAGILGGGVCLWLLALTWATYELAQGVAHGVSNVVVPLFDATLSEVTRDPHEAAGDALVDLDRSQAGEHPDREEYGAAMVEEQRLVLTVTATHAYGMVPEG